MNLLLDPTVKAKIAEILGETPSDLWLDIAWEKLITLIGYDISIGDTTEKPDKLDSRVMYFNRRPVNSIAEVKINDDIEDINNYSVFKARGLEFKDRIITQDTAFPYGMTGGYRNNIEVTYNAGFDATTLPNTLIMVCADMVRSLKHQTSDSGDLKSYKIDTIAYEWKSSKDVNSKYDDILEEYRI